MKTVKTILRHAVCAVVTSAAAGILFSCAAPSYDVEVYLSPKLKDKYQVYPSLEMDLVGVNQTEMDRFEALPINEYFMTGNQLRDGMEHVTLYFADDDTVPKAVQHSHPVWEKFGLHNADRLVLIVNLPGSDLYKGKKNPCRIDIPLERSWWRQMFFSYETKYFEIQSSGISPLSGRPDAVTVAPQKINAQQGK